MRLTKFIREHDFDIVHTHRHQDHLIGGIAARRAQRPLVRSSHDGFPLKNNWRNRYLMRHCTSLYLPVSEGAAEVDRQQFQIDPTHCVVCTPAIDTELFDPTRTFKDMRAQLDIPKDKALIGIVARMQRHRHFEDLLDSWVRVLQHRDDVHFVIVGRGTNQDEVAKVPAEEKGLSEHLTFAGYHTETYLDMLATLDIKMFLVPGSDGSCRALRQALALGIPAVTTERGMLPELVQDGRNGFVTDGSPDALAEAQLTLLSDPDLRRSMADNARTISVEKHALREQTEALIARYAALLPKSRHNSS
jgi:glycosyltransferase involved in cell wall biosynthesis